jgi:hypothetical protein
MFNLILILFIALCGTAGMNLAPIASFENPIYCIGVAFWVISILWVFIAIINNLSQYTSQLNRFETLHSSLNNLQSCKQFRDNMVRECVEYLGIQFPDLEKDILTIVAESGSDKMVLLYPELKSAQVLIALVGKIGDLNKEVVRYQKDIEEKCAYIRYIQNGKWELWKTKVPKHLYSIIYSETTIVGIY